MKNNARFKSLMHKTKIKKILMKRQAGIMIVVKFTQQELEVAVLRRNLRLEKLVIKAKA